LPRCRGRVEGRAGAKFEPVSSSHASWSGRWTSLTRPRDGPRAFRGRAWAMGRMRAAHRSDTARLPRSRLVFEDAFRIARLVAELLPWGFQKTAPPSFASLKSHAPHALPPASSRCLPAPCVAPPSWSLTTSTGSSFRALAGLLHPAPDPGVHRVSAPCRALRCSLLPASVGSVLPHRCSHPPERSPPV
jgi:hypothetical protein